MTSRKKPNTVTFALTRTRIRKMADEADRRAGHWRALVLRQIRAKCDPAPEDVAAALREPAPRAEDGYPVPRALSVTELCFAPEGAAGTPDPRPAAIAERQAAIDADTCELREYVIAAYVLQRRPRNPGPKSPRFTHQEELTIARAYLAARVEADRMTAGPRPTDQEIKASILERFKSIGSVRTLERILGPEGIKPAARRQN